MEQNKEHLEADADHSPVADDPWDPANCKRCGLAITWDAKHHGFTN